MSSTPPPPGQPDLMSIARIIASIKQNMTGTTHIPANVEEEGFSIQLNFGLDQDPMEPGSQGTRGMFKTEKEGGRGTLVLHGGGAKDVHVVLLTPGNDSNYCLGRLGCDHVCLMKQDYCDVEKHEKQKLQVTEKIIHIMTQATKCTTFNVYAEPGVNAVLLIEYQYKELSQEQHTVE
jgi:hypothetical protein